MSADRGSSPADQPEFSFDPLPLIQVHETYIWGKGGRHVIRSCNHCGKGFQRLAKHVGGKRSPGLYCSTSCGVSASNRARKGTDWNYNSAKFGTENPNWKGGVSKDNMRYKMRFVSKNPEKVRAHRLVRKALKDGALRPLPCQDCGASSDLTHAHHDDYSKPLDVRWLCQPCHNRHHARMKWGGIK